MKPKFLPVFAYVFITIWLIASPSITHCQTTNTHPKIDHSLWAQFDTKQEVEFIVLLKDRYTNIHVPDSWDKAAKGKYIYNKLLSKATQTQAQIIAICKVQNIQYQSFYVTNAIKIKASKQMMITIAERSEVQSIIDNSPFKMVDYRINNLHTPSPRMAEPEWGLKKIKADSVWQLGFTGQNIVVGGQDTGYDWDVSPIKKKYLGYIDSATVDHNYSWHDAIKTNSPNFPDSIVNPCGYSTRVPCDDNNHGTHTMGTMVGSDEDNSIGVAPGSKWMACRNMDRGWGRPSTYMECFEWFLAPYDLDNQNADPTKSPHVINNSWYCSEEEGCNPSNELLMLDIVTNLKAAGIVVVVSAGNSGSNCGTITGPPAYFEPSFSVGASNIEDVIAGFSSRGPIEKDGSLRIKPNVVAPGVGVRSVIRNGEFAAFNGTSMSGPHVAGAVALLLSANPALIGNVAAVEDILEATAMPLLSDQNCGDFMGNQIPNIVYGYGRIDVLGAVKRALAFSSTDEENKLLSDIQIFPNPSMDMITISVSEGNKGLHSCQLIDALGNVVFQTKWDNPQLLQTLDLSSLSSGIYSCKLQIGAQYVWKKIVKL